VVARGPADVLEVVVLAARADAFLAALNCTMPAFVKRRVGSAPGTSGDDRTRV